ncbi:MAG TPA: hypothetical protein RMH99_27665, partial [Sandaracinaceae bacterium LLY-WYZ-13_1]|nr:hypothetical protein [Sandaracinaceae bacterium LLY-WYZ-13_1]
GGAARDAGRRRRDAGAPIAQADPETEGEGTGDEGEGTGGAPGEGRGVAFLPEGSQIALRIDVARVRASPFADDVRELLAAIPDWQAVIGGSGVRPLEDLERLLIATPNFDRARVVLAGRAAGGGDAIRAAAEQLASARGETLTWRRVRGFEVADWHDADATDRVVALIGPRHFAIARPQDLPRVLAIARQRARRGEDPAEALLSMGDDEGLTLEVEGARAYYRRRRGSRTPRELFPERLRLALKELPDGQVGMRSTWSYEDGAQAERAATYFDRQRRRFANPLILAMAGVGALFPVLDNTAIEAEGDQLSADADLSEAHVRNILALGRRAMGRAADEPDDDAPDEGAPAEDADDGSEAPTPPGDAPTPDPPGDVR